MRPRDDGKKEAIFTATIDLLNEIGFANISISKIAKAAGVSASTIYIYFENKEDMFKKVYLDVKKKMGEAMKEGLAADAPVKKSVFKICRNLLNFIGQHENYLLFLEQSSNSPLIAAMHDEEISQLFRPLLAVFEKGVKEKILKRLPAALLMGFCYFPIMQIRKEQCKSQNSFEGLDYEKVFEMCWDAIKA
ncbi:MAG: TetR/AcrR family transcriptional regulator [Spirochaetes bacterium]|nr:TetR/AcrR family transcriptional regulator [Spirochaetota bacterium]